MKRILLPLLLLTAVLGLTASTAPRVTRSTLAANEKNLDARILKLVDDNPFLLIGPTRGVYLEGYGAVFTAEVNLVIAPVGLMHPTLTKEEMVVYRQKKLDRMPQLKKTLRDALVSTATSLGTVPSEEQITIVAFLSRYPWEDPSLPVQVTVQGQRKKLIDAQAAGAPVLDAAIRITEY
jgi:hypothetical protein